MTSFKFNFSISEHTESSEDVNSASVKLNWLKSEEVFPVSDSHVEKAHMFVCGDVEIGHVIPSAVIKNFESSDNVFEAEKQHSDLIASKYEGGLKIWECTADLIEYLQGVFDKNVLNDSSILDLGCGAGLLGIMALMNGANVVFQDYNKEVLESVTIPNIRLNIEDEDTNDRISKCKFYSGDWESFNKLLDQTRKFDFILTSETIYNPENYRKIIDILKGRLKDTGAAFIAAKTYYFGVGGGVRQFEKEIQDAGLKSEVCWKSGEGIQREILKVTK